MRSTRGEGGGGVILFEYSGRADKIKKIFDLQAKEASISLVAYAHSIALAMPKVTSTSSDYLWGEEREEANHLCVPT